MRIFSHLPYLLKHNYLRTVSQRPATLLAHQVLDEIGTITPPDDSLAI